MKSLLRYFHDDFDNWLHDPLYHGGAWEDVIVGSIAIVCLIGFVLWQL